MQERETTTRWRKHSAANSTQAVYHCSMSRLRLQAKHSKRLEAMVHAGYPHETCGLLIGRQTEGVVEVVDLVQARNLNQERAQDRYELDPEDFVVADQAAREQGLEIVGIWHSHPDHPAKPSETDRERAWEGWSYLIASVNSKGMDDLRAWRLHLGEFLEESIEL